MNYLFLYLKKHVLHPEKCKYHSKIVFNFKLFSFGIILVALKRADSLDLQDFTFLSTFTTDTTGQLDVLWHNRDTFGMDGAQVGIFKETDQVGFASFLESHDGRRLETQIGLEVLSNFTD
jgi:hypothetical protein